MGQKVHDEPAQVDARPGSVSEVKPDGSEIKMTPDAAVETAVRLLHAAAKSDGQSKLAAEAEARSARAG